MNLEHLQYNSIMSVILWEIYVETFLWNLGIFPLVFIFDAVWTQFLKEFIWIGSSPELTEPNPCFVLWKNYCVDPFRTPTHHLFFFGKSQPTKPLEKKNTPSRSKKNLH